MFNRLRRKLRDKRGFTLIEMILVVGIISVLTALASTGIYGYLVSAYMNRVNETAKTVFLAAQNCLTQEKQMGKLTQFNDTAKRYGEGITKDQLKGIFLENDPSFNFDAYEAKYGTTEIRYILLNAGDGTVESDNPIYQIVKQYLKDDTLLANTFLIEYDAGSGVVRSVFYTEKASTFSYTGDKASKNNVILRSSDVLRQKRQGYYGVSSTSLLKHDLDLLAPGSVKLINGERLYFEWKEVNYLSDDDIAAGMIANATEAFDDHALRDYIVYDIEVYRTSNGTDEKLFSIKNINPSKSKGDTLAKADQNVTDNGMVLSYQRKSNTYQLVLDDLHHSILDMFQQSAADTNLEVDKDVSATDMIYCKISERLTTNPKFEGESDLVASNLQSANYAGGTKTYSPTGLDADLADVYGNGNMKEDGATEAAGSAFSVSNARHLNNIRNASNTSCFVQTGNVDWSKPENDRSNPAGLFVPVKFKSYSGSAEEAAIYQGVFRAEQVAGSSYKISNLTIDCLSTAVEKNVGMFRMNKGTIKGLYLLNAKVKGASQVGAVVGTNAGNIDSVTVDNGNVEGSYYIGGITGKNLTGGKLSNIQCDAAVFGNASRSVAEKVPTDSEGIASHGQYVGGIAGYNQAGGSVLTTTILGTNGKPARSAKTVTGTACVGGVFGGSAAGAVVENAVNYNTLKILTDTGGSTDIRDFGGIVGLNEKDSQIITAFNKCVSFQEKGNANPKRIQNVGGIAGTNKGILKQSKSIPEDANVINNNIKECMTAAQSGKLPVYSGVNVGGVAGRNEATGVIDACMAGSVTTGYRIVGGLVGENHGKIQNAKVIEGGLAQTSGGFVAASMDSAGGIAGVSVDVPIDDCINRAIVFAGSAAGGVSGSNGGSGEYTFTVTPSDSGYYDALLASGYSVVNKNAKIMNCENYGFIHALDRYAGGITGMNFGSITNSNSSVKIAQGSVLTGMTGKDNYKKVAKADCVGGIAGCNVGRIEGGDKQLTPVIAEGYGRDCVGGVAGLNNGIIKEYARVLGNIYASGNYTGGFIGMNLNGESLENLALSDGMQIYGEYFAGGIIGVNIADGVKQVKISGASTQSETGIGLINAKAYAGGIIGYQTNIKEGLSKLVNGELKSLIANAFGKYMPSDGTSAAKGLTIFSNCINRSEVKAERYAGGIVGYNSNDSGLLVTKATNYGKVEILKTQGKVTDGFYFVGGITGRNSAGGIIDQCVNDGSVISPSTYLGGICEVNEGYIQFCVSGKSKNYNDEGIKGDNSVGGLVGLNSKNVVRCSTSTYAKIRGGDNTGGLVGTNDENGIITGDVRYAWIEEGINENAASNADKISVCAGSVSGKDNTGGIVGRNEGRVEQVSVEGATVSGDDYVGGFIGNNMGLLATDDNPNNKNVISGLICNAKKVTGVTQVGGIVGKHNATKIENCVNTGVVEATGSKGYAGGITGSVEKGITIEACTNYGTVTSDNYQAGGIVGNNAGIVSKCRNYGSVSGSKIMNNESAIGGIAGVNEVSGLVADCVSGDNQQDLNKGENPNIKTPNSLKGVYIVGGMVGINNGTINNEKQGSVVSINIDLTEQKLGNAGNIGGVIGVTKSAEKTIRDYVYIGTIQVPLNASQSQFVGGIIGQLPAGNTLENCIFGGSILGYGNDANSGNSGNCGVGGLTGYSEGTIIVNKNKDGIYTSNTRESSVAASTNVGGVAGLTGNTHKILVMKEDGSTCEVSALSENKDEDIKNDVYYVNLASVSGQKQAGGFYGRVMVRTGNLQVVFNYLQNGIEGDDTAGTIKPNALISASGSSLGGITGSAYNSAQNSRLEFANVRNYGTIGDVSNYIQQTSMIGGIVGQCQNGGPIYLTRNYNYGVVTCGNDSVGGVAGRVSKTTVVDCYNFGAVVTKASNTGGVTGYLENSTIGASAGNKDVVFNHGKVQVTANVSGAGGISGTVTGSSQITGIINEGEIIFKRPGNADTCVGGIAGKMNGNAIVTKCTNRGELKLEKVYVAGGIVGYINGSNIRLEDCTNEAPIREILQDGGGIAGKVDSTSKLVFQNNVNKAAGKIYGKFRIGGIIGIVSTGAGGGWDIGNCTNNAQVNGVIPVGNTNNTLSQLGGGIGYCSSNVNIVNFVNKGDIVVNRLDNKVKIGSVSQTGGVIGYIEDRNGQASKMVECENYGSFVFDYNGENTSMQSIGGIAGVVSRIVILDSCNNYGGIDFSTLTNSQQTSIGGIAGDSSADSKLMYCVNQGSILGELEKASNIGGVAGTTRGLVYSCSSKLAEDGSGTIQGKSNVGGIVGYAADSNCKVSSIADKAGGSYAFGINEMTVKGKTSVGGIVGRQQGATVYTMIHSDQAKVILLSNGAGGGSAGGIIGSSVFDGNVPGVVANCYSFGEVKFQESPTPYYLGGVIGNREWRGEGAEKNAAASLKDSFYLYDEVLHQLVDSSQPDRDIASDVLAVGNEPEGKYGIDKEDQQYGEPKAPEISTQERFRWSKDAYEKMYRLLNGLPAGESVPDMDKWDQMGHVLDVIVKNYDRYKLPVPKTSPVTSNDDYKYTLPIERMPGFCKDLEVNIYPDATSDEEIRNETAAPLLTVKKEINMDFQLKDVGFDVSAIKDYKNYVGQVVKVSVKAYGIKEILNPMGEIVYTADSDNEVVQRFVIMPVLVKPEIEVVAQEGSALTFVVKNWAEYQKSAGEFYESIENNPELKDLEIYKSMKNGLENFAITDYYLTAQNGSRDNNFKDTWTINQSDIDADGKFIIDYSKSAIFNAQKSNRQWHDWDMQAIALHRDWSVEASSVIAENHYRYTSSYIGNLKFRIEAVTKLKPPTQLQSAYTGGIDWQTDIATPGYEITFKKSDSPEEAISHYFITVTNPANGKQHTLAFVPPETGEDPDVDYSICNYVLDKDTLLGTGENQLGIDLSTESQPVQLTYTISTQPNDSDAAKFFAASDDAAEKITVIKKAYGVEADMWVTVDNENKPNELTFHWNDAHNTGSDIYLVSYQVKQGENVIINVPQAPQSGREYKVVLPEETSFYEIDFTVVRQGVATSTSGTTKVESLNSDPVTFVQNIGKQLAAVSNVSVKFARAEGESLFYSVNFDIPAEDTTLNCKGFLLEALTVDASGTPLAEAIEIPFDAVQPVEIEIPLTQIGKQFYTYVTARSLGIDYRDSERAQGNSMTIPSTRLNAPTMPTAVINMPDSSQLNLADMNAVNAMLPEELKTAVYTFGWNVGSAGNVKCQQIVISDENGNLFTKTSEDNIQGLDVTELSEMLSQYPGKKLTLSVYNMPLDANLMLPSLAMTLDFYVPKIQLLGPSLTGDPVTEKIAIQKDNLPVLDGTKIPEAKYNTLTYTANWLAGRYYTGKTATKMMLYLREPDLAGGFIETPVMNYSVVDSISGMNTVISDGIVRIPCKAEDYDGDGNPVSALRTIVLSGIDKSYAGKEMVLRFIDTGETDVEGTVTPSQTCVDALPLDMVFTMPLMEPTVPIPLVTTIKIPESTEQKPPTPTEQPVPESTEQKPPMPTEQPIPESTEQKAPESTEQKAPESTEQKAPESTEQKAPESTEQKAPESTEQPVAESTEQPVPESTEQKTPISTEQKVPESTEQKPPAATEQKAPESTEKSKDSSEKADVTKE